MTTEQKNQVIAKLVETNSYEYNLRKSVEELLELAEVIMKKLNKKDGPKEPKDQEIVEEIGDVTIRLHILGFMFGNNNVNDRVEDKLTKFNDYLKKGKYIGKI